MISGNCDINNGLMDTCKFRYRKMDFVNPIVNKNEDNEFTTIRRGIKWADLQIGERILIMDGVTRIGKVTGVKVKRFMDLTWKDLNYNFQEGCASDMYTPKIFALNEISKAMEAVYPDFDYKEIVTWIKIKDSREIE
mgnify:CR=1 FL=1